MSLLLQIMVTAATSCAAVWLAQYCGAKHVFTVGTVGVVSIAAYGIACAFLTMHEQARHSGTALMQLWLQRAHLDCVRLSVLSMLYACMKMPTHCRAGSAWHQVMGGHEEAHTLRLAQSSIAVASEQSSEQ